MLRANRIPVAKIARIIYTFRHSTGQECDGMRLAVRSFDE
jgi:hypothetical protein